MRLRARYRSPAGRWIEVAVTDLSSTGCRIDKPDYELAPDQIVLRFFDGRPDVQAEIVWQNGNSIGVKFAGAPQDAAPAPRAAPEVHKISLNDLRRLARGND